MTLSGFIQSLWQQGKVTVAGEILPFENGDVQQALVHLREYYTYDVLDRSGTAPAFHSTAALWAAAFLYRTVQLALLRDAGEETVKAV